MQIQPLRLTIRHGPFGPESLFAKTFKKMRDEESLVETRARRGTAGTGAVIGWSRRC